MYGNCQNRSAQNALANPFPFHFPYKCTEISFSVQKISLCWFLDLQDDFKKKTLGCFLWYPTTTSHALLQNICRLCAIVRQSSQMLDKTELFNVSERHHEKLFSLSPSVFRRILLCENMNFARTNTKENLQTIPASLCVVS